MTFPSAPDICSGCASSFATRSTISAPPHAARFFARLAWLFAAALLFSLAPLHAQALQQTVNVGGYPNGFAVDPVYNQIYVANAVGGLSVIDGTSGKGSGGIPRVVPQFTPCGPGSNFCTPCGPGMVCDGPWGSCVAKSATSCP